MITLFIPIYIYDYVNFHGGMEAWHSRIMLRKAMFGIWLLRSPTSWATFHFEKLVLCSLIYAPVPRFQFMYWEEECRKFCHKLACFV